MSTDRLEGDTMDPSITSDLPIVVIGAGPVGLATAVHLVDKGAPPLVLEAGDRVGANVLSWGHVRMFSPWELDLDRVGARRLEARGWTKPPAADCPTGHELVRRYLDPLAALPELRARIRLGARVTGVSRVGRDRLTSAGRERAPFVVHVATPAGPERVHARAVIDASGTVGSPSPLGADGLPAIGERELAQHIVYGIPDVVRAARSRYAGRRTLVVGSGHSAFNVLLDLAELAADVPPTRVSWAIRRDSLDSILAGGADDALPERGRLGQRLQALLESRRLTLFQGFRLDRLTRTPDGIVASAAGRLLPAVDEIVSATGFRPDLGILRELRTAIDPVVECPAALAPVIDPNVHSCGTVPPHGEDVLRQPEPGLYLAGMKSYGRAPNFLMRTGYEQVRSIACALTGDRAGARTLTPPATGACSSQRGDVRSPFRLVPGCAPSSCEEPRGDASMRREAHPVRDQEARWRS
jgi:hypothetical protein